MICLYKCEFVQDFAADEIFLFSLCLMVSISHFIPFTFSVNMILSLIVVLICRKRIFDTIYRLLLVSYTVISFIKCETLFMLGVLSILSVWSSVCVVLCH